MLKILLKVCFFLFTINTSAQAAKFQVCLPAKATFYTCSVFTCPETEAWDVVGYNYSKKENGRVQRESVILFDTHDYHKPRVAKKIYKYGLTALVDQGICPKDSLNIL